MAFDGGNDPGRDPQQQREQDGADRQLDRGREQRQKLADHRLLRDDGLAQVTVQHAADVDAVLNDHRPVEAVFLAELLVAHGVDTALARHRLDGVAGNQPDQEERQQRHPEESRDDQRQAGQEETEHGA